MNKICKECVKNDSPCKEIKIFINKEKMTIVNKTILLNLLKQIQNNGGCSNIKTVNSDKYYKLGQGWY